MKRKKNSLPWFGLITLFFVAAFLYAGTDSTSTDSMKSVIDIIQKYHFSPSPLDDTYSQKVFNLFLKRIDPGKRFLTQADLDILDKYRTRLDDDAKSRNLEFVALANKLFNARVKEAKIIVENDLKNTQTFTENETFETDASKRKYATSREDWVRDWHRFVQYQILTTYIADAENSSTNVSKQALETIDSALEKSSRTKVKKNLDSYFDRIIKETDSDRINVFLDCLALANDPHTQYFAPQQKEDFDINIKGSLEGIGAILEESDGYIKVNRVVPGSPAWKQKELRAQDCILKVSRDDGEPVDIVGMRVQDAVRYIRGPKGTRVTLTVRKPEGKIVMITITRDVVILEESYAKSAIIVDGGKKTGYIVLPSFYRDFSNAKAHNASDDLRNELLKLKAEGANQVILDLRNNGGGALDDAVKVAGLFIDHGPIVQVRDRNNNGYANEDHDPSVVFNGKLIILVNAFSASAAEIVTAALQDYGRAIVIGGAHTYGKGTVQTVINLDSSVASLTRGRGPGVGSIKVTNQKYFRVTGASTQFKGVEPDIVLPDINDYLDIGEQTQDYPLSWTTTNATTFRRQGPTFSTELLNESRRRVASDANFKTIEAAVKTLKHRRHNSTYPLNLKKAVSDQRDSKKESRDLEQIHVATSTIYATPSDPNGLKTIEIERQNDYNEWLKQIPKDVYINEALNVLRDWGNN